MNGGDWEALEEIHQVYPEEKRYWADSSVRAKRWRARQGKAVLTYLHPSIVKALHEEAKRKNKSVWKLLRSCVSYGLPQRRGR